MENDLIREALRKQIELALSLTVPEYEEWRIFDEIKKLSPDPYIMDYIYHSPEFLDENGKQKIDEIIEKAM